MYVATKLCLVFTLLRVACPQTLSGSSQTPGPTLETSQSSTSKGNSDPSMCSFVIRSFHISQHFSLLVTGSSQSNPSSPSASSAQASNTPSTSSGKSLLKAFPHLCSINYLNSCHPIWPECLVCSSDYIFWYALFKAFPCYIMSIILASTALTPSGPSASSAQVSSSVTSSGMIFESISSLNL
jgi:hypothetical protein